MTAVQARVRVVDVASASDADGRVTDALLREGLQVVPSPEDAVEAAPEAVVRRADLEQAGALDALRALCSSHAGAVVVLVVPRAERSTVARAMAAGVAGIVLERDVDDGLGPTVHAALAGQIVAPRDAFPRPRVSLSVRERQLLAMVVMGFSNAEIARKLHLTESTVKSHLASGFRKLGVRTRAQATALILDPDSGLGVGILAITEGEAPLLPRANRPARRQA